MNWQIGLVLFCILLNGCSTGKSASLSTSQHDQNKKTSSFDGWEVFGDPVLSDLFKIAKEKSPDLKKALARIEEARFEEKRVLSDQLPKSDISVGVSRSRDPKNLLLNPKENCLTCNQSKLNFDASWEFNLLGMVPLVRAAKVHKQAMEESYQNILITLYGDIAKTYFIFRQFQHQIVLAKKNIHLQSTYVKLLTDLNSAGKMNHMDVAQAEALSAKLKSDLSFLEKNLKDTQYRLEILVGEKPDALEMKLSPLKKIQAPSKEVVVVLPAKSLMYRPDVKAAELSLAQAGLLKKVAMAQYFPNITLSALMGFTGSGLHHLVLPAKRVSNTASNVVLPFFDFGRIRSEVNKRGAQEKTALAEYEQTLLNALHEIHAAYSSYFFSTKQRIAIEKMVEKNQLSLNFATERYRHGLSSYLEVLLSFKALNESEHLLIESKVSVLIDLIKIYKSLGIHGTVY